MLKKLKLWLGIIAFVCVSTAHAVPITGSVDSSTGGGLFATGAWAGGNADLSWSVNESAGLWTYDYHFVVSKQISHVLFQTSATFTDSNVKDGTTAGWLLDTWGTQGQSNVGIPSPLYGIKFAGGSLDQNFTIVSDRAPMWGSFYARDGVDGQGRNSVDVLAYNTNFGGTSNASIFGAAPEGYVLVPDTVSGIPFQVSEPGGLALLGVSAIMLGGITRLRDKRRTKGVPV